MRFLTFDELLALHVYIMQTLMHEEYYGVLNAPLLHSAFARSQHASHYESAPPLKQAAYLFHGLLMNHGFVQGNKRTAYAALEWFIGINKLGMIQASSKQKVEMCVLAENKKWNVDKIEQWLVKYVG